MSQIDVLVPRINSNDDWVRLVEWQAELGAHLAPGASLATLDTAKAAIEIESEQGGYLRWRCTPSAELVRVGAILAVLTPDPQSSFCAPLASPRSIGEPAVTPAGPRVTLKARALARALANRRAPELELSDGRGTLIVGDGAHARYLHDTCLRASACRVVGCVSNEHAAGQLVGRMPVLGRDDDLAALYRDGIRKAIVGVGSSRSGTRSNEVRQRIFERLLEIGFELPAIVDPDASLSASARLGAGAVVGARAVVSAHAVVGRNCLVNVGAILCHDVVLADHVHVTPGAILAGGVQVGEGSTIGMAATVLDGTRIGRQCLVPNNARVIRDLPDGSTAPFS